MMVKGSPQKKRKISVFCYPNLFILGLILLAAWLRLWQLPTIPPGLWFDESRNGMEAVWMLKTNSWPVFILQGQGREALFFYFLALSISVLGETVYAIRLVPALLGILSIPLMYRWVLTLFKDQSDAISVALFATAGLTISFWYLVMNRIGYRANTLIPLFLFTAYFFWRGWQTGHMQYYLIAGVGLGLCQYTYLAGRLVPLVFIIFGLAQTLLGWKDGRTRLKRIWLGLVLMGGAAVLVIIPLGLFFIDHPELFWERGGDVSLKVEWTYTGLLALGKHLAAAGRIFIDGQDLNWRHNLVGRPVLDWFSVIGFWTGLVLVIRHWFRPINTFLLAMLWVMWLPAVLSETTFHTLRLVGILPIYYVISALGWLSLLNWLRSRIPKPLSVHQSGFVALIALLLFSGGTTFYDYFYRWARLPEVYQAFDGSVVALARGLTVLKTGDVIIPYYLYTHASMRYLLESHFQEAVFVPETAREMLRQRQNVPVIIPEYPPDDGTPQAFVWLAKSSSGTGTAYVSTVIRDDLPAWKPEAGISIEDDHGHIIARQYEIDPEEIILFFVQNAPQKKTSVEWDGNLLLSNYQFIPQTVKPGDTSHLYLAWQIRGYTGLQGKMFLQLLDSRGNPAGQKEIDPISRKMYRWRSDGLILEQHPLEIAANLNPGLYFVRLGFFNPETGQRLPASMLEGQPSADEFIGGPFYVSDKDIGPQYPVQAVLGEAFEFLGYSLSPETSENSTVIELYWKTNVPVEINYTVFLQLLNEQGQVVAQVDAQPLANIYPTSRWQPGDMISEQFVLPRTRTELFNAGRLVTGMYDLSTGARLPVYDHQGNLLPDGMIRLDQDELKH